MVPNEMVREHGVVSFFFLAHNNKPCRYIAVMNNINSLYFYTEKLEINLKMNSTDHATLVYFLASALTKWATASQSS